MSDHEGESYPQTIPPCPSWCTLPAGHGYDSIDYHGALVRSHACTFGYPVIASVELTQTETTAPCTSPDVASCAVCDPVVPELHVYADEALTGPQARALAGWLLQAADAWSAARS
jgi:hypothetical protein